MPKQTPSQTVGPFFAYGLTPEAYGRAGVAGNNLLTDSTQGERIRIEGVVYDGNGAPVSDAMLEIWQADAQGRYPGAPGGANSGFTGFARCGTGTAPDKSYRFETVKPGCAEPGSAPHINMIVFSRGLLSHAYTRVYFDDEATANNSDPVLALVPKDRRNTLIAKRLETDQGDGETVFFDL